MSEAEMNSYRLTSMEEPGDERMAQIMRSSPRTPARALGGLPSEWLPESKRLPELHSSAGVIP